jgi:hypothetical protein
MKDKTIRNGARPSNPTTMNKMPIGTRFDFGVLDFRGRIGGFEVMPINIP